MPTLASASETPEARRRLTVAAILIGIAVAATWVSIPAIVESRDLQLHVGVLWVAMIAAIRIVYGIQTVRLSFGEPMHASQLRPLERQWVVGGEISRNGEVFRLLCQKFGDPEAEVQFVMFPARNVITVEGIGEARSIRPHRGNVFFVGLEGTIAYDSGIRAQGDRDRDRESESV